MSDQQEKVEKSTEAATAPEDPKKIKRARTQAQLDALARAREKAFANRKAKKEQAAPEPPQVDDEPKVEVEEFVPPTKVVDEPKPKPIRKPRQPKPTPAREPEPEPSAPEPEPSAPEPEPSAPEPSAKPKAHFKSKRLVYYV